MNIIDSCGLWVRVSLDAQKFYSMKEIKQCPLKKEKCAYRTSRISTLSGCSLYDNVNLCTKCAKYRKRQGEHTIKELKKYNRYRQPGCKL